MKNAIYTTKIGPVNLIPLYGFSCVPHLVIDRLDKIEERLRNACQVANHYHSRALIKMGQEKREVTYTP